MSDPVVDVLTEAFASLGIDVDTYAEYAAGMLTDESTPVDERVDTLTQMLSATVEGADDANGLEKKLHDTFRKAIEAHARVKAEAEQAKKSAAIAHAARVESLLAEEAARVAAHEKAKAEAASASAMDACMKRSIMMQYGYEYEDEEGEEGGAPAAGLGAITGSGAQVVTAAPRRGGLDSALEEIDSAMGSSVDTAGLGRRAKRAAVAAATAAPAPAASSGKKPASTAAVAGKGLAGGTVLLDGPHAGQAQAKLSAARSAASAHAASKAATATFEASRRADLADIAGDDVDEEKPVKGRAVVEYDPLVMVNNREHERELQRQQREEQKMKNEAEQRRLREAAEAARAARERAKQVRVGGGAAASPTSGGHSAARK